MPGARYQLLYYTDEGQLLDVFPIGETSEISCVYAQNETGILKVAFPPDGRGWSDFAPDRILVLQRNFGTGYYTEGAQAWLLRDWDFAKDGGQERVTLSAYSGNSLLDGRIVAYAAGSEQAGKTAPADDLIKAIVRENLGTLAADTERALAGLSVEQDLSLAPEVSKAFSRKNVLRAIQEVCDAAAEEHATLYFDTVTTTPGSFLFRTWINRRGIDRSSTGDNPLSITPSQVRITEQHSKERNFIYCGGAGTEETRIVETASNEAWIGRSRYNRREKWEDARNGGTNAAYVQGQARVALWDGRPRLLMEGTITGEEGLTYGQHYNYGDVVTVKAFGYAFDCHISAVSIYYRDGQEDLRIKVRGEL